MQPRDAIIRELQKHNIPFEPLGPDIGIVCFFDPICGGISHDISTLILNGSTRSGNCRCCGKTAPLYEIFQVLGIGSVPEFPPKDDANGVTDNRSVASKTKKRQPKSAPEPDERVQPVEETIEILDRAVTLTEVHEAFEKIGAVSRDILDIVMASAYSSLRTDLVEVPLWTVLVGPPSSMKTELVKALNGLPHIYYLDTLTSNPFASGYVPQKGRKAYDLLDELDGKCLVIRDMTTLFSLNEDTVKKLLGELVAIYDQEFAKFSATRGRQSYKARFSLLGCITPAALNNHRRYIDMIGPRFLFIRVPELTAERQVRGFEIAWQSGKRSTLIRNARQLLISYVTQLANAKPTVEPEEIEIQEIINGLAKLVSRGRGVVISHSQSFKGDDGNEKTYYEIEDMQREEPWRALLQLRGMGRCLAAVRGERTVTTRETKALANIALSSMPPNRAEVVTRMFWESDALFTAHDLHERLPHRSQRTIQRLLKELQALELVDAPKKETDSSANQWFLNGTIKSALINAYGGERDTDDWNPLPSLDTEPPLDQPADETDAPHSDFLSRR